MLAENDYPALVLNADFRPISIAPLSTMRWTQTVKDQAKELFGGGRSRFIAVDLYDRVLRSRGSEQTRPVEMLIPSVIVHRDYVDLNRPAAFTRAGLFLRDRNRCAYCRAVVPLSQLTFDHVHPRSQGGPTTWQNVVAACGPCNFRKANRTPAQAGMKLHETPVAPTCAQLNAIAATPQRLRQRRLHKSWLFYLGLAESDMEPCRKTPGPALSDVFPENMSSEDYWYEPLT